MYIGEKPFVWEFLLGGDTSKKAGGKLQENPVYMYTRFSL